MENNHILLDNIESVHTTEMGVERIRKNLNLETNEVSKRDADTGLDNLRGRGTAEALLGRLKEYSENMKQEVQAKDKKLQEVGYKNYSKCL